MKAWCDLQERAHSEARKKLNGWGVYGEEAENILAELIGANYLNEERFARAFARGKSRIKAWGWKKIEMALKAKGVSAYSLKAALEEIDQEEYFAGLINLAQKKERLLSEPHPFRRKQKLLRFLVGKGYSYDEAKKAVEEVLK
ncbi:MAG TPA: regulatory protein RecX [Cryomorphaceae bacterium]|nr:regulatory protein RecX [Cryomorphaceae bacterium]